MDCLFEVGFTKKADREYKKLDLHIKQRIWQKIVGLENFSRKNTNIKRLVVNGGEFYRLRMADYRILFEVEWKQKRIWILSVGHRREVYK